MRLRIVQCIFVLFGTIFLWGCTRPLPEVTLLDGNPVDHHGAEASYTPPIDYLSREKPILSEEIEGSPIHHMHHKMSTGE